MKLSVEFPSVSYREGPEAVRRMAQAIERIGYDHIDIFDHVVMGHPMEGRPPGPYNAAMPIIEALMGLSYLAAVTSRVTLGTEVLVLPQREPTLVAKQISTLDTLSGGRVRLGIGVGWQESEYEAMGEDFHTRGARMDEAIQLLRTYWGEARVDFAGKAYRAVAMAMEPKPPQGRALPIWVGGNSEAALRRVGRLGDGWLASRVTDADDAGAASTRSVATRRRPGAIPARSACRAWSRRHPATPRASASTPSPSAWWRARSSCRRWASAGSRSTPRRCSRRAPARSTP